MRVILMVTMLAAACGTDNAGGPELLQGFDPGPAPANGMQVILPIVKGLEPGVSHELCSWTNIKVDHQIDVRKIAAVQAVGGHHIALFVTKVPMPAGTTHECTDADMTNFRMVAAANQNDFNEAPGDLVYRLPQDTWIAVQEHFINATDTPIDSQGVLNIYYADPGTTYTPSQGLAFVNTDIQLPPGANGMDIHCTMQQDIKAWYAIPHMHKYGTAITVEHVHAATTDKLVDLAQWDPGYEFHPPEQRWDVGAPLTLAQGDQVNVHCSWNNTTTGNLRFGNEMCVFFAETIDDQGIGNIACDNGDWGPF